jgi:hypothetical protein
MTDTSQAPATKQDMEILMQQILKIDSKVDALYDANKEWKDEILESNKYWKDEMIHEFHIQAPATKLDIAMMMEEFGKMYEWKEEISDKMDSLYEDTKQWREEIIHEFHIIEEDLRHDAMGAQKDKIENHEDRIKRVEDHLQLSR